MKTQKTEHDYGAVILCGGHSFRMGRDKARISIGGEEMLDRMIRNLTGCRDLTLSVNEPGRFADKGLPTVVDKVRDQGPLAGLHAALSGSSRAFTFVTPCDCPFVDRQTAETLAAEIEEGIDVIVPMEADGRLHPLTAIYRNTADAVIAENLAAGDLKIRSLFAKLKVKYVPAEKFTLGAKTFVNINTPEELEQLKEDTAMEKIDIDTALARLDRIPVRPLEIERVPVELSTGRVLAEDVCAAIEMPPFDRSYMDGFALRSEDIANASADHRVHLAVLETIGAGDVPEKAVTAGNASRIMTGALMPEGADCVVKFEDVEFTDTEVVVSAPLRAWKNVARKGSECPEGTLLIEAGREVTPAMIGVILSQGIRNIKVYRKPVFAVITTGSELVDPLQNSQLPAGKIFASSHLTIRSLLEHNGFECIEDAVVEDDPEKIRQKLEGLAGQVDLLLTTGGASGGDYDFAVRVIEEMKADLLFDGIRIRPGNNFVAGCRGDLAIISLSGNPGAALSSLIRVAAPYLQKLKGSAEPVLEEVQAYLSEEIRRGSDMTRFLNGKLVIEEGRPVFRMVRRRGGAVMSSYIGNDLLAEIPGGSGPVPAGTLVRAWRLRWTY